MSQPTIHDIAKILGISASTVSRALNNNPRIKEETRIKVQNTASELGYSPNKAALGLRKSQTGILGLLAPLIDRHYFSAFISGAEECAQENKYSLMICQSKDDPEREKHALNTLVSARVDGIMASHTMFTKSFEQFEQIHNTSPLIFFDRVPDDSKYNRVESDNFNGAYTATKHLISKGCKNIAYITAPTEIRMYRKRLEGYKKALMDNNLLLNNSFIITGNLTSEHGKEAAEKLFTATEKPDGIFACNDTVAISLVLEAKKYNINIPNDIALIGYSNEPASAYISPSISTIQQHAFKTGYRTCKLLIDRINNKNQPPISIKTEVEVIERESSRRKI